MKKFMRIIKVRVQKLTSYQAVNSKFSYRLYSKEFIENAID